MTFIDVIMNARHWLIKHGQAEHGDLKDIEIQITVPHKLAEPVRHQLEKEYGELMLVLDDALKGGYISTIAGVKVKIVLPQVRVL